MKENYKNDNNFYKKKIYKRNNLTKNIFNKISPKKTKDSFRIINTSPSLSIKRRKNNSLNRYNLCKSKSQKFDYIKYLSNLNSKKIIFVNKKKEYINSLNLKNILNQNKTLNSSPKDFITLYNNKESNKIVVHKKDELKTSSKKNKKTNNEKNKKNSWQINDLAIKNSLKNYRSFIETEYNTFIPNLIIKKMFFNKINNEKNQNNSSNKCSPLKKLSISSKNNQKISKNGENIEKIKTNYKKQIEIKNPITNSTNKLIKKNEKELKLKNSAKIVTKSEMLNNFHYFNS